MTGRPSQTHLIVPDNLPVHSFIFDLPAKLHIKFILNI